MSWSRWERVCWKGACIHHADRIETSDVSSLVLGLPHFYLLSAFTIVHRSRFTVITSLPEGYKGNYGS